MKTEHILLLIGGFLLWQQMQKQSAQQVIIREGGGSGGGQPSKDDDEYGWRDVIGDIKEIAEIGLEFYKHYNTEPELDLDW